MQKNLIFVTRLLITATVNWHRAQQRSSYIGYSHKFKYNSDNSTLQYIIDYRIHTKMNYSSIHSRRTHRQIDGCISIIIFGMRNEGNDMYRICKHVKVKHRYVTKCLLLSNENDDRLICIFITII